MAKLGIPDHMIQSFTLAVFVFIIGLVIFLRVSHSMQQEKAAPRAPVTLQEYLDSVLPTSTTPAARQLTLTAEALTSSSVSYLDAAGDTVTALVSKPTGSGPFPAAVIVHGGSVSSRVTDRIAAGLGEELASAAHVVTITIDWREGTATPDSKIIDEIEATVGWLRAIQEVDDQPIVLFGLDSGVNAVLRAVSENRDLDVQGVIDAYGPIASESAEGIDVPVLIVHARQDTIVPITQSDALAATIAPSLLTYAPIEDPAVDHDFFSSTTADGFDQGVTAVTDWLTQTIQK